MSIAPRPTALCRLVSLALLGLVAPVAWAQSDNNDCANAVALNLGDVYAFNSCGATVDGNPAASCAAQPVVSDFWFSYTFAANSTATFQLDTLAGAGFVEVYAGTCGALGAPVACAAGPIVAFSGAAGAVYLIRAGYFDGTCGGENPFIASVVAGSTLPSGFTYQGQLAAGGAPVNGAANLEFRLFDFFTGGAQVGPAVYRQGVNVVGGLFGTLLDFGPGVCDGRDLWLEITADGSVLTPRQQLTASPYALYAVSAGTANYAAAAARADNGGSGGVFIESFSRASMGDVGYNSNAFVPVVQTDKVVSLPAGKAVFDWTLPGMSTGSGKVVQLRANIAGVLGPAITYWFGDAFTELPMCGHIVVAIPQAVAGTVRLEVKVPSPSGGALWYPGVGSPNGGVNGNGTGMSWTLVVYKD